MNRRIESIAAKNVTPTGLPETVGEAQKNGKRRKHDGCPKITTVSFGNVAAASFTLRSDTLPAADALPEADSPFFQEKRGCHD
jgi:hypothetical protein